MESPTKQQRQQQQLLQLSPAQLGSLERHGMRLDELNRVRVIDEETENHAQALRDVCNEFIRDTTDFQVSETMCLLCAITIKDWMRN